MYFESAIHDPLIGCFVNIEEYSIPFKYRNVNERLILLITTTIKNQTHPIWFNDNQIDNSMICDSLIYKQMNDWLLDWSNGKSSMIPNPIQFNRIWSNSSLVAVIIQLFSLFIVYSELYSFNKAKSVFYFNLKNCIALSIRLQWIHKWNNHQISIHSNHSIVSLSNPIFLIIRSNQFAINIEQILIQTILWLWLVDWNHCHLWMFNMWSLGHW